VLDDLLAKSHPEAGRFKHNYQSVRVVDRLERRYAEPGLNLTNDVREGIFKHTTWRRDFPFPLDFVEGLRFESGGTLEAQVVNWSDEIAQQTHDLEDGIELAGEAAVEALTVRRASLIRGMIATLTHDLVEASRSRIEKWLDANAIRTPQAFFERSGKLPG